MPLPWLFMFFLLFFSLYSLFLFIAYLSYVDRPVSVGLKSSFSSLPW